MHSFGGGHFVTRTGSEALINPQVDESGTTAAAASGFRVSFRSLPQRFIADKPFMFLIMDRENGVIIFMGHILEPHT